MSRVLLTSAVVLALILSATAAENEPLPFRHVAISASGGDSTAFPIEAQKLLAAVRECGSNTGELPCAHAYSTGDRSALIVEVCRSVPNYAPGLYIFRAGHKWQYPWFDARFMAWACTERSKDGQETSYFAIWESDITGFHGLLYSYYINLEEGFYYLRLQKKGRVVVIDHVEIDLT